MAVQAFEAVLEGQMPSVMLLYKHQTLKIRKYMQGAPSVRTLVNSQSLRSETVLGWGEAGSGPAALCLQQALSSHTC